MNPQLEVRTKETEDTTSGVVDVIVIGAGMAGLSTAVYAARAGLSVTVFEQHTVPGGLCTSWTRAGYVFDYCVEYLVGTGKGQGFFDIWNALGVLEGREFRHIDSFGRYIGADGKVFNLYTNYRRLRDHMLELAPEDRKQIIEFCRAIRWAKHMYVTEFTFTLSGLARLVRSAPALPGLQKWAGRSLREWCAGLKNDFLRESLPALVGTTDFPMAGPIMMFAMMDNDRAGYPVGGSLPLARAAENRAKSLGATFVYGRGVQRILVEKGRAVGIELEGGEIHRARHIVAACDARSTFDVLLAGQVKSVPYEAMFQSSETYPSILQVSLGVKIDPVWRIADAPPKANLPLVVPIIIDGRSLKRMEVHTYLHDTSMAPDGRTVILVRFEGDYGYWKKLRADKKEYSEEKERVLKETIRALEERYPGISSRIEAKDVATPASVERYTGNWKGSSQGWVLTVELMKQNFSGAKLPKTFPGVDCFHLIGQWSEPGGGLPIAAREGRDVVNAIRKTAR